MITENQKKKIAGYRLVNLSYKEIGKLMSLSPHTVKKYSGEKNIKEGGLGYVSKEHFRKLKKDYDNLRAAYKTLQDKSAALDKQLREIKELVSNYKYEGRDPDDS